VSYPIGEWDGVEASGRVRAGAANLKFGETRPIDQSIAMIRHSGATDMPQDQSKLAFPARR